MTWHRPTGVWDVDTSLGQPYPPYSFQWGLSSDEPLINDCDGDGIGDATVWRNSWAGNWTGTWFIKPSSGICPAFTSPITGGCYKQWGLPGDIPLN